MLRNGLWRACTGQPQAGSSRSAAASSSRAAPKDKAHNSAGRVCGEQCSSVEMLAYTIGTFAHAAHACTHTPIHPHTACIAYSAQGPSDGWARAGGRGWGNDNAGRNTYAPTPLAPGTAHSARHSLECAHWHARLPASLTDQWPLCPPAAHSPSLSSITTSSSPFSGCRSTQVSPYRAAERTCAPCSPSIS